MLYTRLANETEEYRKAREDLRLAEVDLIAQRERVAQLRRDLPLGPVVEDYAFLEGPSDLDAGDDPVNEVRLSELFTDPARPLIVYQMMYGKAQTEPCPMCTMWIDGYNGIAHHVAQNADFVIAAAAEPKAFRDHGRTRGWQQLRLLSCGDSTFKYDTGSETEDGAQQSTVSVFARDDEGNVRLTYTGKPERSETLFERGIDQLCATWHLLDLTPQGRGDWYPSLSYGA
jgi:predicted dithiol-disulfide oxidoreductase (DUF899 family)